MTIYAKNGLALATQAWLNDSKQTGKQLLVVNLMPNRAETELQFLTLLDESNQDCQVTFAYPDSHVFRHADDVKKTYLPLSQAYQQTFDGVIVTGAPVEKLDYSQVDYWQDFQTLVNWAKEKQIPAIFECWASQAALYQNYAIGKKARPDKLFGVFDGLVKEHWLTAGCGGMIRMPQSRHTDLALPKKLPANLKILATSNEVEAFVLVDQQAVYITGHPEYGALTLEQEYQRDLKQGKQIISPKHYQQENNWWQTGAKLYGNWLKHLSA